LNRHSSEQKVPSSTTSTDSFDDTEKTGEQKSKTSTVNSEREDSLDSKKNDSSSTVNNDQSGEQDSVELKEKNDKESTGIGTMSFVLPANRQDECQIDEESDDVMVLDSLKGQTNGIKSRGEKVSGEGLGNLELQEAVSTTQDAGSDLGQTQHGHDRESSHKMAEGEENHAMMMRTSMAHAELKTVTGSAGSSETGRSASMDATMRVTHLLDELTAVVSRLRLDSSDGKEMTIQLRRDVLADTNIQIVSTSKQMEVSFLTSNAASNLLLNTHLTTLQNHLNALCPGQVVTVQTQLTPSSSSSHLGNEQDQSHDDLASFDQGNRGNEAREE
jgi:hypothetical protein